MRTVNSNTVWVPFSKGQLVYLEIQMLGAAIYLYVFEHQHPLFVVCLALAVAFVIMAVLHVRERSNIYERGDSVVGEVVALPKTTKLFLYPVTLRYHAANGTHVSHRYVDAELYSQLRLGSRINVKVLKSNVEEWVAVGAA